MASTRSSKRQTPRKTYTVDAFEGITELQPDPNSADQSPILTDYGEDQDDFNMEQESSDTDEVEIPNETSSSEDENHAANSISRAVEVDMDEILSLVDDANELSDQDIPDPDGRANGRRRIRVGKRNDAGETLHTRGVEETSIFRRSGKIRKQSFYGPTVEDTEAIIKSFTRWSSEATFPTRKPRRGQQGGLAYPLSYEKALELSDANWEWYTSRGGQDDFRRLQILLQPTVDSLNKYMQIDGTGLRSCVLGPLDDLKLYRLNIRQSITLSQAYEGSKDSNPSSRKPGFLLNIGAHIQALDWTPNQSGHDQYLAVSTLSRREEQHPRFQDPEAPAFKPRPQHPSSIQVWRFRSDAGNYIDTNIAPHLITVVCTNIGDIKCFKWCPVPFSAPDKLGLLACIGMDGSICVVDLDKPPDDGTTYNSVVENFAFRSKPPDTVCTCLTWISSTRIAAGCANGFVAVWDISKSLKSKEGNPRPVIYTSISVTYILAIDSCWPSHPDYIVASSMAGHLTLTDLSKPNPGSPSSTATSIRTRVGQSILVWNGHTQSAYSVDDNYTVRSYMLRRFFATIGIGKYRAFVLCMATSPCHPYILAGIANGEVVSCNPIVRVANNSKAPLWQQTWFKHEWRRPTEEELNSSTQDIVHENGLARILEGFKVENVNLNSDGKNGPNIKDGSLFTTIYEENTAITFLAWNPNIHVGGWAAAGMADGLLRVEDIAL